MMKLQKNPKKSLFDLQGVVLHNWCSYKYTIQDLWVEDGEHLQHFICKWARVDQVFLAEDIPGLIADLPFFIDVENEDKSKWV